MRRLFPVVLALPLTLVACGEGFTEEVRSQAWDVHKCAEYRDTPAAEEASAIRADVASGTIPAEDHEEAEFWISELDLVEASEEVDEAQVRHIIEVEDVGDIDNMCTGWLWEYHSSQDGYYDGYEDFDESAARDAGVLREGPF